MTWAKTSSSMSSDARPGNGWRGNNVGRNKGKRFMHERKRKRSAKMGKGRRRRGTRKPPYRSIRWGVMDFNKKTPGGIERKKTHLDSPEQRGGKKRPCDAGCERAVTKENLSR